MTTYFMCNTKLNKLNFSQVIFKVVLFLKIHLYYFYNLTVVCKKQKFCGKNAVTQETSTLSHLVKKITLRHILSETTGSCTKYNFCHTDIFRRQKLKQTHKPTNTISILEEMRENSNRYSQPMTVQGKRITLDIPRFCLEPYRGTKFF